MSEAARGSANWDKNKANDCGLSKIELESSWWGNEKFGAWVDEVWALIDYETDKAFHVKTAKFDDSANQMRRLGRGVEDVWVPKSKAEIVVEPDWEVHSPDGEAEGEVVFAQIVGTRYGPKVAALGDTYDAFKETGIGSDFWDDLHATFNGDVWVVDRVSDELIAALVKEGFRVKVAPYLR